MTITVFSGKVNTSELGKDMRTLWALAMLLMLAIPRPVIADQVSDGIMAFNRKDYATALRLWRPLAERGNADAQSNLGVMYATGRGVPKNNVLAYMWFNIANAKTNRDLVAGMMTPRQITEAQRLSRKWKAK